MKRLAFFTVILCTFYLAGMFRSLPLMALCVAELLLTLVMLILPRYFRARLSAEFQKRSETTYEGTDTLCRISVRNGGRLPISRVGLRLRVRNIHEKNSVAKNLYCIGDRGDNTLEFKISSEYCGLVLIQAERLRAYDYLSLFSSTKQLSSEMRLAVFPRERSLNITISELERSEIRPLQEQTADLYGDDHSEIRRIREYLPGDPERHIHRNLSARTDRLWIKEYERETSSRVNVLADMSGLSDASAKQLSAFYKLLSALVLGLLKEYRTVGVYRGGFAEVSDAEQCRDMLLWLYRSEQRGSSDKSSEETDCYFRLTSELSLFAGDTLICQFSAENLDSEIDEKTIVI